MLKGELTPQATERFLRWVSLVAKPGTLGEIADDLTVAVLMRDRHAEYLFFRLRPEYTLSGKAQLFKLHRDDILTFL